MLKTCHININYLLEKTKGVQNSAFSAEIKEYAPFLFSLYSCLENTLIQVFFAFFSAILLKLKQRSVNLPASRHLPWLVVSFFSDKVRFWPFRLQKLDSFSWLKLR